MTHVSEKTQKFFFDFFLYFLESRYQSASFKALSKSLLLFCKKRTAKQSIWRNSFYWRRCRSKIIFFNISHIEIIFFIFHH